MLSVGLGSEDRVTVALCPGYFGAAWSQKVGTDFSAPCRNSVYAEGLTEPYSDKGNPVVAKFLDDFNRYQPGRFLHQWGAEGWGMGLEFQHAAESMGSNLTRKGFMNWLNNLDSYTIDGFARPHDYKPINTSAPPRNDCFSVPHWQDSAQTFVLDAPITTCYSNTKWVGSDTTADGS